MSVPRSPRSHAPGEAADRRFTHNPFFVLDLSVDASAADVRRAAARLCTALAEGDPAAARYATPLGPRPRDAAMVMRAATQLRHPDDRVQHEIWAAAAPVDATPQPLASTRGWDPAWRAFGWRSR